MTPIIDAGNIPDPYSTYKSHARFYKVTLTLAVKYPVMALSSP